MQEIKSMLVKVRFPRKQIFKRFLIYLTQTYWTNYIEKVRLKDYFVFGARIGINENDQSWLQAVILKD